MSRREAKEGYRIVEFMHADDPDDGIVLIYAGWSSQGFTELHCGGCGAKFNWLNGREDYRIPDRRHLNYCPGCGKIINGVDIPDRD